MNFMNMQGMKMKKVILNKGKGDFNLSPQALELYIERKPLNDFMYEDKNWFTLSEALKNDRENKVLINVIEELGKEANGVDTDLVIQEIEDDDRYLIDYQDGKEVLCLIKDMY